MPKSAYSAMGGILFALTVLPALVNSFDREKFVNPPPPGGNTCALGAIGDGLVGYSDCMVSTYGVSPFIQCAGQKGLPDFSA